MRALTVPLLIAAAVASLAPANAAPQNTAITAVYQCASGSCTKQLSSGDIARGLLRIDVQADDNLGNLSMIRLEAIGPGDPDWSCIRQFSAGGAKHVQTSIDWSSGHWPFPGPVSGCTEAQPHKHGEVTLNGTTTLRVVATESGSNATQTSSAFTVRLANPPQPPVWRGEPSVSGGAVTLRWYRNPELDTIEYRYVRTDAAGRAKTIAVNAAAPTKTAGCEAEKEATFTCVDHPPGGRVRYVLQAFRKSPGGDPRCTTQAESCVGPASSTAKVVTVASSGSGVAPPASSSPTASPSPYRTAQATVPGTVATTSPSTPVAAGARRDQPADEPARGGPLALASVALAALLVGHVVAAGRRRS